jgi:release factor glutamine methyltransferase
MTQVRTLLDRAEKSKSAGGRLDAELLLAHCLDKPRSWLFAWPEAELDGEVIERYQHLWQRRSDGIPLAYLLGEQEFWSLSLTVNEHTLVPRADTETLVQWALEMKLPEQARVADLGTGSGAIALALASERPAWQLTATDVSTQALEVAVQNAARHELEGLCFLCSDWLTELDTGVWNLLISNPPYIAENDPHLRGDGLRSEPKSALVSGADGLEAIRHIIEQAPRYLGDEGWLLLEHGFEQGSAIRELMREAGFLDVSTRSDLAGQERATGGMRS